MNPLVSVIIPAYNKERHISACLESVIRQDLPDLEVILVDDASNDSTAEISRDILGSCGRNYSIITHSTNMGVSCARNTGLDVAEGKYIWFCDADDIAGENLASVLSGLAEKYGCDISFGGITNRFEDGRPDKVIPVKIDSPVPFLDGEEAMYMRVLKPIAPVLCCMLFRKRMIDDYGLRFYAGCSAFEDIEFELKAFCHAGRISFTTESLYIYIHGAEMGSIRDNDTREKIFRRYSESAEAHMRSAEYISNNAPSSRVKFLADNILIPEAVIRRLTNLARYGDKDGFMNMLDDSNTREILRRTRNTAMMKPEIFFKAYSLLHFPRLYFRMRTEK